MVRPEERRELDVSSRTLVPVSSKVLRWARESIGASLDEAAKRIQQDAGTVRAWESAPASADVSVANLRELADFYDRPLSVFLLDEPPPEPHRPPDLRAPAGRDTGPLSRRTLVAIRHGRRVQALVRELRGDRSWIQPPRRSDNQAVDATSFRRSLGVPVDEQRTWGGPGKAFSQWRGAIERTGIVVLQADVPLDDVKAMSIAGDPPVIVINEHDYPASKVFSLFHECAHLLVGDEAICTPLEAPGRGGDRERAADLFAGAVLVPASDLRANELIAGYGPRVADITSGDLTKVAAGFGVSTRVIWYRLRQTAVITSRAFSDRWDDLGHPVRSRSKASSPPRIPRWQKASWRAGANLASELLAGQDRGLISIGSALRGLEIHLEDIDRLTEAVRR
jgi:Zn-dependent peptidase ImmA (M78 family)/transcriptional regulator with XRE-family HTH domain